MDDELGMVERSILMSGVDVEVGVVIKTFIPWAGPVEELKAYIDAAVASATFPLEFGDLFWVSNTPAGDELGRSLLDAGQTPIGNEPGIGGR